MRGHGSFGPDDLAGFITNEHVADPVAASVTVVRCYVRSG
jgi:hypothetical protein